MALASGFDDEVEFTLLNKRQAKVYQIPPAVSADGHRADDWKESIWIGRCRVVGKGTTLMIKLLDGDSDKLFAQCTIPNGDHEKYVERVIDSSRYFVLKVTNDQRHAFIGFGFSDRNDAFDFLATLGDFKSRFLDADQAPTIETGQDLSLKQGQTITVNLSGIGIDSNRRPDQRQQQNAAFAGSAPIPFLAPPPTVERPAQRGAQLPSGKETAAPLRPGEFQPAPPCERLGAKPPSKAYQADAPPLYNAPANDFADFQSAPGALRAIPNTRGAEAAAGQKSFVDYLLPMSFLGACTVDTRSPDAVL